MEFEQRKESAAFMYLEIYNWGTLPEYDGHLKRGPLFRDLDDIGEKAEHRKDNFPASDAPKAYGLIAEEIRKNLGNIIGVLNPAPIMREMIQRELEELAKCYEQKAATL